VARRRGSAAIRSEKRRTPAALASSPSRTEPPRITLSATISVPGPESSSAAARYSALAALSASMKMRSNGPSPSAASAASVSRAGPARTSTTSASPARARFRAGDLGVAGVELERHQPAIWRHARASEIVLYAPSVPSSRIARARWMRASSASSLPWVGETPCAGRPAAALASSAASRAASGSSSRSAR
jgi:hypothetical protein